MSHRILLATFGSLGDLHPFLGLARALRDRGHAPVLAASPTYAAAAAAEGVAFRPVGPDLRALMDDAEAMARSMDLRRGSAFVVRELVMPHVRAVYDDLAPACAEADLVVAHPFAHAAPAAAEVHRVPWVSVALQPSAFLSAHDPPALPVPLLSRLRPLGPPLFGPLFWLARRVTLPWVAPLDRLHDELGLPRVRPSPAFGRFSPRGTLALFSSLLAAPQPDWPPRTCVSGFVFHDVLPAELPEAPPGTVTVEELERFVATGPPPVVFTLGSTAVHAAGDFYVEAAEAARRLGVRAVLLVGTDARNVPTTDGGVVACAYAPYGELFPRAAAVVHHGGIGTTGQALRAGRPALIVPYSHDQPDNAARAERLGVSRTISRRRFRSETVVRELGALLERGRYAERAEEVGRLVRSERGPQTACDVVESVLAAPRRP